MQAAKSKTRRQKVEEKERAILSATRHVFRNGEGEGCKDVKISAIARQANLAEGTVYLYFKNKQTLLMAAVSNFYDELTRDAQAVVALEADTLTKLTNLARLHFERVLNEWPLIAQAMSPDMPSAQYRETESFALNRRYIEVFDLVVRDGIRCGDIRDDLAIAAIRNAFYGGLEHCARSARLRMQRLDLWVEVDNFLAIFVVGITNRPVSRASSLDGAALVKQLLQVIEGIECQISSNATRHRL